MNRMFDTGTGETLMINDVDALTFERECFEETYEAVRAKAKAVADEDDDEQVRLAVLKALMDEVLDIALEDVLELKVLVTLDEEVTGFEWVLARTVEQTLNTVADWKTGVSEPSWESETERETAFA
ncbi:MULTISPECIES: hypothetical protein [unclassified Haloferax]|uniref:hypothetical protein n=1 Tax=unclassified Haloferax TaxID=2625095 RepID=UPI002873FAF3|nr:MULTISPECIES: hypothetical protein [unclassified Haloferax]MDS0243070.1 hypothetical protein [Haloferax sp. S2CR25]MDS0446191.1 hypothetical protein [Haloferax sp. S2CR25-2]